MKPILILYASQTGMTADVATALCGQLAEQLPIYRFALKSVREVTIEKLADYSTIILGSSTWDHGIPAPDGEEFLSRLIAAKPDLSTNSYALFGLGDSAYPEFCGALPLIEADLQRFQGRVYPEQFMIDGFATQATMTALVKWATNFIMSS